MTIAPPRPTATLPPRQRVGEPNPGRWKPDPRSDGEPDLAADSPFRRRYDSVQEKVSAIVGVLDASLDELCTDDGWDDFVDAAARMPRMSANNLRLLQQQMPDVSDVADFKQWKERGRTPRKGAQGLLILKQAKVKLPLTDPTGEPILDARGQQLYDERATGETTVGTVFDISQTDGPAHTSRPPLPDARAFAAAFRIVSDEEDPEDAVTDVARMRLDVLGGDDTNIEAETHAVAAVLARRWGVTEPVAPYWVDRSPAAVRASSVRVSRVVSRLLGTPLLP